MPDTIQFKNGNQIINKYDAGGKKLASEYRTLLTPLSVPLINGEILSSAYMGDIKYNSTCFVDNYEYKYTSYQPANDLVRIYNSEGYVMYYNRDENYYAYFCRNHLGSIREVWLAYGQGETIQRTQYYPSGMPWDEGMGGLEQPFRYSGKEWIEAHGLDEYDSEARMYYPAIMRITTIDPLCEKYYHISPYAWCGNNPVNMIDPDGRDPKKLKDWFQFGKSIYKATTAVVTLGLQGSAKVNVGTVSIGVNSNPGSFDLVGVRDGKFTPNKNKPTVQSGGEISIGIASFAENTTIKDNGTTTTKTASTSAGITIFEGVSETKTEIDNETNEIVNQETESGIKVTDVGVKAGFIIGVEMKIDMKKIEEALKKLIHE
ncbi:MAG: RHS repeat-associated core domain-containing protein [Bacteroidales bacterium]|nr:RHS repeat-associated core domain-containing protein [Bacteroidales bacterium]